MSIPAQTHATALGADFIEAAERALRSGMLEQVSDGELERVMTVAVRLYAAKAESEKDGKLVTKVESRYLSPTDYSPELKVGEANAVRVFELRTYTTTKGNLPALDARFRDHTMKLFDKHGMRNLVYWHLLPDQKGADNTLIYMLAHKSPEAAKASFDAFRGDPAWKAALAESEKKAGGPLTEEGGVVSEFLKPTDYSPLK